MTAVSFLNAHVWSLAECVPQTHAGGPELFRVQGGSFAEEKVGVL